MMVMLRCCLACYKRRPQKVSDVDMYGLQAMHGDMAAVRYIERPVFVWNRLSCQAGVPMTTYPMRPANLVYVSSV